jgi:hypothetical protein
MHSLFRRGDSITVRHGEFLVFIYHIVGTSRLKAWIVSSLYLIICVSLQRRI